MLKNPILYLIIITTIVITSCQKDAVEGPNDKIAGTWNYESITIKESGSSPIDYWALVTAFYPCSKNISINFAKDNVYTVSEPSGCTDEDGIGFSILPSNGTFELSTDKTTLKLDDGDGFEISGGVVFTDNKMTWTITEDTDTIVIVFKK